jgi:tetratricopeptide (TPR) repeat protein
MKKTEYPTWPNLFKELNHDDQYDAVSLFLDSYVFGKEEWQFRDKFLLNFATAINRRTIEITNMAPEVRTEKLLNSMHSFFSINRIYWGAVFWLYYLDKRTGIMNEFIEELQIPASEYIILMQAKRVIGVEELTAAAEKLRENHSFEDLRHFYYVFHLLGSSYFKNAYLAIQKLQEKEPGDLSPDSTSDANCTKLSPPITLDNFSTLDLVMLKQIRAMMRGEEGCLEMSKIQNLIETLLLLNTGRLWSYYLLGYLDGVDEKRLYQFNRLIIRGRRRAWYMAGILVARTEIKDQTEICKLLDEYPTFFSAAVSDSVQIGEIITNKCLAYLFQINRFMEAMELLQSQMLGPRYELAKISYGQAVYYLRNNQIDLARPILDLLIKNLPKLDCEQYKKNLLLKNVYRRLGQCFQNQKKFDQAAAEYQRLLADASDDIAPKLYADLGLIAGGYPNLDVIRLSADASVRINTRNSLSQGEEYFQKAIAISQDHAVNANYCLGLRDYLYWADVDPSPAMRDKALTHVDQALIGIRESAEYAEYEKIGIFGQAQFMKIVLSLDVLAFNDSNKLLAAWEIISKESANFPVQDLKKLLLGAELINPDIAADIANCIWQSRNSIDAWSIIDSSLPTLLQHSTYLQNELLKEALSPDNPRAQRIEIWMQLIPTLIKLKKITLAIHGLDTLEELVEESGSAGIFLEWLGNPANYDPIWTQNDADWARLRIARKLGKEGEFSHLLDEMFYRNRDQNPIVAEQIAHLFADWNIDAKRGLALIETLATQSNEKVKPEAEKRLRDGEKVKVIFVGGNEIQSQYDESITNIITKKWPGCSITFKHTGWSSNWGRDVDALAAKCNEYDAVVIMYMMRTLLGKTLRNKLTKPWIPCNRTGRDGMLDSIQLATLIGLQQRDEVQA